MVGLRRPGKLIMPPPAMQNPPIITQPPQRTRQFPQADRPRRLALIVPIAAVVVWAGNTIVSRSAAGVIDPIAMTFYRWAIAAAVLTPFCLGTLWLHRREAVAQIPRMALLAFVGMVLNQLLTYFGAHATSAVSMGLIFALIPALALALASLVFGERASLPAIAGVAVSLLGVVVVIVASKPQGGAIGSGALLILASSAAYALYTVLLKRWTPSGFGPWLTLYVQVLLATAMLAPMTVLAHSMAVPARGIGLVLFAGVGASLVGGYLWILGVRLLGSARAAITMNLMPVFTAVMAHQWIGEPIHAYHWLGGMLILAGVLSAQRISARERDLQTKGAA